jgi:cytochrome c-type biogenesis protein CcmH/NrfG
MSRTTQNSFSALNAMTGVAGILFGLICGYILGAGQAPHFQAANTPVAAALPQDHATTVVNETELQAYRDILAADPKNARAAIELANRLYDAGRYADAVPYYRQAVEIDPRNVSVSTDLATALYYSGRTDEALEQFKVSLAIDPTHAQTLFNVGIVRRDGKQDAKGASEAWQRLLDAHPNYPDAERVRTLLAQAK